MNFSEFVQEECHQGRKVRERKAPLLEVRLMHSGAAFFSQALSNKVRIYYKTKGCSIFFPTCKLYEYFKEVTGIPTAPFHCRITNLGFKQMLGFNCLSRNQFNYLYV